jgi:hypothetical protein
MELGGHPCGGLILCVGAVGHRTVNRPRSGGGISRLPCPLPYKELMHEESQGEYRGPERVPRLGVE